MTIVSRKVVLRKYIPTDALLSLVQNRIRVAVVGGQPLDKDALKRIADGEVVKVFEVDLKSLERHYVLRYHIAETDEEISLAEFNRRVAVQGTLTRRTTDEWRLYESKVGIDDVSAWLSGAMNVDAKDLKPFATESEELEALKLCEEIDKILHGRVIRQYTQRAVKSASQPAANSAPAPVVVSNPPSKSEPPKSAATPAPVPAPAQTPAQSESDSPFANVTKNLRKFFQEINWEDADAVNRGAEVYTAYQALCERGKAENDQLLELAWEFAEDDGRADGMRKLVANKVISQSRADEMVLGAYGTHAQQKRDEELMAKSAANRAQREADQAARRRNQELYEQAWKQVNQLLPDADEATKTAMVANYLISQLGGLPTP